jgi:hypothetical protein
MTKIEAQQFESAHHWLRAKDEFPETGPPKAA